MSDLSLVAEPSPLAGPDDPSTSLDDVSPPTVGADIYAWLWHLPWGDGRTYGQAMGWPEDPYWLACRHGWTVDGVEPTLLEEP